MLPYIHKRKHLPVFFIKLKDYIYNTSKQLSLTCLSSLLGEIISHFSAADQRDLARGFIKGMENKSPMRSLGKAPVRGIRTLSPEVADLQNILQ